MLLPVDGSYYRAFLQSDDPKAKKILEALDRTILKYSDKETVKEAILRLTVLSTESNLTSTDEETKLLLNILNEFKAELKNVGVVFDDGEE